MSSQASGTGKAAVSFGGSEAGAGDTAHTLRSRAALLLVLVALALTTTLAGQSWRETRFSSNAGWNRLVDIKTVVAPRWTSLSGSGGVSVQMVANGTRTTVPTWAEAGQFPKQWMLLMHLPTWIERAANEPPWTATTVGLATLPLLFWWWRRSHASFGRIAGLLLSVAVGTGFGLVLFASDMPREWNGVETLAPREVWLLPVCGLFLLAFLVAPSPVRGERAA